MHTLTAAEALTSTLPVVYWLSADSQSSLDTEGSPAREALAELLAQCGEDDQRDAIMAGAFQVGYEREQVESLRDEAAAAGDRALYDICVDALDVMGVRYDTRIVDALEDAAAQVTQ